MTMASATHEQWEKEETLYTLPIGTPCESRKKSDLLPIRYDIFDRVLDGPDLQVIDGHKEISDQEQVGNR
jgi:hypothetical protein